MVPLPMVSNSSLAHPANARAKAGIKKLFIFISHKTFTLKNYLPKGTLEFTKTDYSTDKALPNTVIEIYTEDDVLMGTYTTDDKGMVIIKDLPLSNGKRYYILEKQTSDSSYLLNEEKNVF